MRAKGAFIGGLILLVLAGCSSSKHVAARGTTTTQATSPSTTGAPTSTTTTSAAALPIAKFSNWSGIKPTIIYFSGDSGNIVSGITWSSWVSDVAIGQGMWGYDDCNPNCAQGKVTNFPTTIRLSGVTNGQFTQITEIQTGPYAHTLSYTLPSQFIGAGS